MGSLCCNDDILSSRGGGYQRFCLLHLLHAQSSVNRGKYITEITGTKMRKDVSSHLPVTNKIIK